jgi:putative hydrolase
MSNENGPFGPSDPNQPFGFGFGNFVPGQNPFGSQVFSHNTEKLINAEQVRQVAKQIISSEKDQFIGNRDLEYFGESLRIADTWLDPITTFPATTSSNQCVWTRRDWMESSVKAWQEYFEPLANGLATALVNNMEELMSPESMEMQGLESMGIDPNFFRTPQFLEQIKSMMRVFMGTLIGNQLGQSIGQLAMNLTGSLDVGMPLISKSVNPGFGLQASSGAEISPRLIPANVAKWGEGLGIREDEIRIFLSLRESAAARLFAHTPWLANHIQELLIEYGRGIQIDLNQIRDQAQSALMSGQIDPANPESINIALNSGLFTPEKTERQEKALERMELLFALIDGWINQVVESAAGERLPSFNVLNEVHRRARAISSPVQQLFSSLLGLEVSPRLTRQTTEFWKELTNLIGNDGRDARWEDVSLLPGVADLADPAKFLAAFEVPDDLSGLFDS